MPRPSKKRQAPEHLRHVFQDEWLDDWTEVANHLARLLKLPDLGTRSGLKKVHANLSSIQHLLDETFKYARQQGQTKIMAGVTEIYIKMTKVDGVLLDKLLVAGFYERLVTLADFEDTRAVALRALETVALANGKDVSPRFRKCAPSILKIALNHLDHQHTLHAATSFFAHSSQSVQDLDTFCDITALGRALLDSFHVSRPTLSLFDHAMICFSAKIYNMAIKCRIIPSFITIHLAFLRSEDYMRRVMSLCCLLDTDLPITKVSPNQKTPCCFTTTCTSLVEHANIESYLPLNLLQIVDKYGMESTHISNIRRSRAEYASILQESMSPNADLCKIGRDLAHLIQSCQYALPDCYCCHCGGMKECPKCFPKLEWPDLLKSCTEELCGQTSPSDDDTLAADILQWKLGSYVRLGTKWERFSEAMTVKHPEHAIFRYLDARRETFPPETLHILTTTAMKCPNIPRWLDYEFRSLLVEAGFEAAVALGRSGDEESHHYMLSARTNAKFLLDEGPPDDPRRAHHAAVYILSHLMLEGPTVNFKKPTIKRALKEIELSNQFTRELMGGPIPSNHRNRCIKTLGLIRDFLPEALTEWGQLLKDMNAEYLKEKASGNSTHCSTIQPLSDDCRFEPENPEEDKEAGQGKGDTDNEDILPEDGPSLVISTLGKCSLCGRASAGLRKCGGCGKERYCDTQCQKFHWEEHKAECLSTRFIVEDVQS